MIPLRDPMIDECYGYTVYGHLTPSLKWYFGITKRNPEKRWGKNGCRYKGQIFYSAIQKYGWNNIWHHIVGTGYTKEEACYLERKLIAEYETTKRDKGYNATFGGDSGLVFTDELKQKHSEIHKNSDKGNRKRVKCLETGKVFPSAIAAAQEFGFNKDTIANVCRGNRETAYGQHWIYVDDIGLDECNQKCEVAKK